MYIIPWSTLQVHKLLIVGGWNPFREFFAQTKFRKLKTKTKTLNACLHLYTLGQLIEVRKEY